jgi:prepilin-type N-terminal cleavage/methylation domain-containing protein
MSDMRLRRSPNLERGFTLIELMIAIIVITVGILGISGGMATMMRRQEATASRSDMATVADSKFEDLRSFAGAQVRTADTMQLVPGGSITVTTAGYNDVVTERGRTYTRRWAVTVGVGGARQVILRVVPQATASSTPVEKDFVTLITM